MHLFGEEFLDVLIAETNLLEGKIRKVTLEVPVGWKPINHKELIVFWGLTNSMGLMINKSMKGYGTPKTALEVHQLLEQFLLKAGYPRCPTLCSIFQNMKEIAENQQSTRTSSTSY